MEIKRPCSSDSKSARMNDCSSFFLVHLRLRGRFLLLFGRERQDPQCASHITTGFLCSHWPPPVTTPSAPIGAWYAGALSKGAVVPLFPLHLNQNSPRDGFDLRGRVPFPFSLSPPPLSSCHSGLFSLYFFFFSLFPSVSLNRSPIRPHRSKFVTRRTVRPFSDSFSSSQNGTYLHGQHVLSFFGSNP